MSLDRGTIESLGSRLVTAERERFAIDPLSADHPTLTAEDAYRIQQVVVGRRVNAGDRIVGYKVGLTSPAMQELLGVDQPDYAPILGSMLVEAGTTVERRALIAPKAEAEIALILREPLRGPGVTPQQVMAASAGVAPAIEVIDSRIRDWKITLVDTVADMASSARVVLGKTVTLQDIDLGRIEVTVLRNGTREARGEGSAVLGHPAAAVAWAVNTLGTLGVTMEAGHVIMPGALHAALSVEAGDHVSASFTGIGSVEVRFT